MKKILLVLVILFALVGCKKDEVKVYETKVGELDIKLDSEAKLKDMSFIYSSSGNKTTDDRYFIIDHSKDNMFVFRFAVNYYDNQTIEDVMNEKNAQNGNTKKIGNIEWKYYEGDNSTSEETYYYAYLYNNGVYLISFISNEDMNNYINIVMDKIVFK